VGALGLVVFELDIIDSFDSEEQGPRYRVFWYRKKWKIAFSSGGSTSSFRCGWLCHCT